MSPTSVPSPCVGVCVLNSGSICTGCGRHIDEIAAWSQLGEAARQVVVDRSALRMEQLRSRGEAREKTT